MQKPRKVVVVEALAAVAAAFVVACGGGGGMGSITRVTAQKPWVTQNLCQSQLVFDAPWALEAAEPIKVPPQAVRVIASSQNLRHEADGMQVGCTHIALVPGVQGNLDGAADGSIAKLRTVPGTTAVKSTKQETMVLDMDAREVDARIEQQHGAPLQLYSVVFGKDADLFEMQLIADADQPMAAAAWKRLRASIRPAEPAS
jgi:hypothetical protein